MDNIKLSFILPVFNVGSKNLSRCISSIGAAMKLVKNSELVIINDESAMWDEEKKIIPNDPRVRVHNQGNKGLGFAMASGLSHASGVWVWFIDPRDSIISHNILSVVKYLNSNPDADFIQFGAMGVNSNGDEAPLRFNQDSETTLYGLEILNAVNLIPPTEWNKIYRREYLTRSHVLNFQDKLLGDQEFLARVAVTCTKCVVAPCVAYRYRYKSQTGIKLMNLTETFSVYMEMRKVERILECVSTEMKSLRLDEYKGIQILIDGSYESFGFLDKLRFKFKVLKYKLGFIS